MRPHRLGEDVPNFFPLGFWVNVSGGALEWFSLSDFIYEYLYNIL